MPGDLTGETHDDDVQALKTKVEDGFQKRLRRLGKPVRGRSGALHNESFVRMLVESAADATADDEMAIRLLQESLQEKNMEPRSRELLRLDLMTVRGMSNAP
ncbi:MAG: hypothetical protein GXY85_00035 [Candidatus Brocadiaceae bacterium]|nr:hypothetical protein [Candidatus Brocadiaceae bacterium]